MPYANYGVMKSITAVVLAKKILDFTSSTWIEADDFSEFAEMLGIMPGEAKVDFYQRLLALIKRMPDSLVSIEMKSKIADESRKFLDKIIEEEENLYEENKGNDSSTNKNKGERF